MSTKQSAADITVNGERQCFSPEVRNNNVHSCLIYSVLCGQSNQSKQAIKIAMVGAGGEVEGLSKKEKEKENSWTLTTVW